MKLDLNNVFDNEGESLSINQSLSLAHFQWNAAFPFQSPVSIVGTVSNHVRIVTLAVQVRFTYHGACDRCAELFDKEHVIDITHDLVTQLNDDENDDYLIVEDGLLDLDELMRSDILLALPTKILCRHDCQGLCPICGQNLNQSHCNCKMPTDPRLEALLQLLEQ